MNAVGARTAAPGTSNPFRVPSPSSAPLHHRVALTLARPLLDRALALPTFRRLYQDSLRAPDDTFTARALRALDIRVSVAGRSLRELPASGPLLVVANHPHGILDGLALAHLVHQRRGDVRVLTSHLLASIPDLADLCLFVDPFGGTSAAARSRAGLRAARRWLGDGHGLIVFPAGSVAHLRGLDGTPIDSPWHTTAARLVTGTNAIVVPAFISGANSDAFYRAGRIHERLRTLLLGRELLRKRGRSVAVHLGGRMPVLGSPLEPAALTDALRGAVERLGVSAATEDAAKPEAIAAGPPAAALAREIEALPKEALLLRSGAFDVFCADAAAIPALLRELGRLREISFRAAGEGTGNTLDLDRFDDHYRHLFVWNREAREIAGAYRLGLTDEIVRAHGIGGLYTSTLFRYDARLLARLGPAIELGRSFVRAEYQRSSIALLLLWKGIARVVATSGRYRVLFGPVSISSRYADVSHELLKAFLTQNHCRRDLAELVEAITPSGVTPARHGVDGRAFSSVGELDRAIAAIESDGKGMPVLLRQYLKLNAKLMGFNVDPAFGDALDALMMVDLADVAPAVLRRYFGNDARLFAPASRHAAA